MFEIAVIIIAIALLPLAFFVLMATGIVFVRVILPIVLVIGVLGGFIYLGFAIVEESRGQGLTYWLPFGIIGILIGGYAWGTWRELRRSKSDKGEAKRP